MDILICIGKSILGYLILIFIGTNLLGLIVRGIRSPRSRDGDITQVSSTNEISNRSNWAISIFFSAIAILYFYSLYHFWNTGIALAGVILMFTRLPDLLYELRTGEKINRKNIPKQPIDILCTILLWAALPLAFYSLCLMDGQKVF